MSSHWDVLPRDLQDDIMARAWALEQENLKKERKGVVDACAAKARARAIDKADDLLLFACVESDLLGHFSANCRALLSEARCVLKSVPNTGCRCKECDGGFRRTVDDGLYICCRHCTSDVCYLVQIIRRILN